MFYWSICWAGMVVTKPNFSLLTAFDIRINPMTRHKFVGRELKFPFTGQEIRKEKVFGEVAPSLFQHLTPDTLVVGHAFDNDARMIIDTCKKFELPCPEFDYTDSNVLWNVKYDESGERSLSKVAEKYGIEFTAHDPLEDARATLEAAKAIVEGDIFKFITRHDIEVSTLKNSLMYKGGKPCDSSELKEKTRRANLPFIYGAKVIDPKETFYFDPQLLAAQDLTKVLEALSQRGCGFTSTAYSADTHVTNNLLLGATPNVMSFRSLVNELGLENVGFDFTPKKVRGKDGKAIPLDEYYRKAYASSVQKGILNGKGVSFSKAVERSVYFEDMISAIMSSGGKVCFNVADSDIFVVTDKQELKMHGDGRLRAYRRYRKQEVLNLEELSEMLK